MNIVIFTHPDFLGHQSMPRFASMLSNGMLNRGHEVQVWAPSPVFFKLIKIGFLQKWLGYVDQFIIFPIVVKKRIKQLDTQTLFVISDNALGPWVPLIKGRPHVMHCHDFLAQKSALGQIAQNKTGITGKLYQKMIRNGYQQCHNFISVSNNTKDELHGFLNKKPKVSEVVYNGLNRDFVTLDSNITHIRGELSRHFKCDLSKGFILHVGGNQWYKNRVGILEIYNAWRSHFSNNLPLILVGEYPDETLVFKREESLFKESMVFLTKVEDEFVNKLYGAASVFLFPSLAEGFGWPIAEAMASGSLVITTNEAPMNEVASDGGFYIAAKPSDPKQASAWAKKSAEVLESVINLSELEREKAILKGLDNAKRFDQNNAIDAIEKLYKNILEKN